MANFTNPQAFARHVREGANVMQRARRSATVKGAIVAKEALLGAPGAPHNVAGRPTSVSYSLLSDDAAIVKWVGPAHLVNNPTVPHAIEPKNGQALKFPDGNIRYSEFHGAPHPGTHGKRFYEIGRTAAQQVVPEVQKREFLSALGRHF